MQEGARSDSKEFKRTPRVSTKPKHHNGRNVDVQPEVVVQIQESATELAAPAKRTYDGQTDNEGRSA